MKYITGEKMSDILDRLNELRKQRERKYQEYEVYLALMADLEGREGISAEMRQTLKEMGKILGGLDAKIQRLEYQFNQELESEEMKDIELGEFVKSFFLPDADIALVNNCLHKLVDCEPQKTNEHTWLILWAKTNIKLGYVSVGQREGGLDVSVFRIKGDDVIVKPDEVIMADGTVFTTDGSNPQIWGNMLANDVESLLINEKFYKIAEPPHRNDGGTVYQWLDYYHSEIKNGQYITYRMLENLSGYAENTFKQASRAYKIEHGIE